MSTTSFKFVFVHSIRSCVYCVKYWIELTTKQHDFVGGSNCNSEQCVIVSDLGQ